MNAGLLLTSRTHRLSCAVFYCLYQYLSLRGKVKRLRQMNKKINTLLFIICATLFNIIVALVSFIVFTILYIKFLMMQMPETSRSWAFTIIFLAAIGVSFLVYRIVIKHLIGKIEIEKYFDPIFARKYRGKKY